MLQIGQIVVHNKQRTIGQTRQSGHVERLKFVVIQRDINLGCRVIAEVNTRQTVAQQVDVLQRSVVGQIDRRNLIVVGFECNEFSVIAQVERSQFTIGCVIGIERSQSGIGQKVYRLHVIHTNSQLLESCQLAHIETRQVVLVEVKLGDGCCVA